MFRWLVRSLREFSPGRFRSIEEPALYAIFCVAATCYFSYLALNPDSGIPDRKTLVAVSGKIASVSDGKPGVWWRFAGRPDLFFLRRVWDADRMAAELAKRDDALVTFHHAGGTRMLFPREMSYEVWQIDVDGRPVWSFQESARNVRDHNAESIWVVIFFLGLTGYFAYGARLAWLKDRYPFD